MRGPMATAMPVIAPQIPMTLPRRSAGVGAVTMARASGTHTPPAAPCTARAATRTPSVGASAHKAEAMANRATPTVSIRRRPKRSPSIDPARIETANARA